MAQQTAVEWLYDKLKPFKLQNGVWNYSFEDSTYILHLIEQAKQMERQQLSDAMMYALDEDGHTGDWKVKFINDYIDNL